MLSKNDIDELFIELNEGLRKLGQKGEIGIVGGAVMCLVFNARKATRDVDAIFEPSKTIRKLAKEIAKNHRLPDDWLNDAAKGYLVEGFKKTPYFTLSNLVIWSPEPRYMLAMKCISARWDSNDRDDVIFLIKYLKIKSAKEVFSIIQHYYKNSAIPAKTQFFVEEIFFV